MLGFNRSHLLVSLVSQLALGLCMGNAMAQGDEREDKLLRDSLPGHTAPFSLTAANQLQIKGQVYAYATRDSLYLGAFHFYYPVSMSSCMGVPVAGPRLAHALPGPRSATIPPIALLTATGSGPHRTQATVAYVLGGTLYRYKVTGDAADKLTLSAPVTAALGQWGSNRSALAVAASRNAGWGADDSSVMVSGTGGYLRHVQWTGGQFGAQLPFEPLQEDIRHMQGRTLAGAKGRLFNIVMDAPWLVVGQAGSTAPDLFDEEGALWNSGDLLVREGLDWTPFKVPAGSYRAFRLVRSFAGLFVRLYPEQGPTILHALGDRPTRIERATFHGWEISVPIQEPVVRHAYYPVFAAETLYVRLADPEGNFEPPLVDYERGGVATLLTDHMVKSDPPYACQPGSRCLNAQSPWFHVIMKPDSVRVSIKGLRTGYTGGPCPGMYSYDTDIAAARAWTYGDRVKVTVGDRAILIYYDHPDGILTRNSSGGKGGDLILDRRQGLSQWPWPGAGSLSRAMLFSIDGRPMGLIGLKQSLAHLPAGTAFLRPVAGIGQGREAVRLTLR